MTKEEIRQAYKEVVKPIKLEYENKIRELFKKYICGNCKYNIQKHCVKWDYDLNLGGVDECSAFDC